MIWAGGSHPWNSRAMHSVDYRRTTVTWRTESTCMGRTHRMGVQRIGNCRMDGSRPLRQNASSAKPLRQNTSSAKCLFGKMPLRQNLFSKTFSAKLLRKTCSDKPLRQNLFGKMPVRQNFLAPMRFRGRGGRWEWDRGRC